MGERSKMIITPGKSPAPWRGNLLSAAGDLARRLPDHAAILLLWQETPTVFNCFGANTDSGCIIDFAMLLLKKLEEAAPKNGRADLLPKIACAIAAVEALAEDHP